MDTIVARYPPNFRLRQARTGAGLSQDDFARQLGEFMRDQMNCNVSPSGNLIGMWERGEVRPSGHYRRGLAAFTGLTPAALGFGPAPAHPATPRAATHPAACRTARPAPLRTRGASAPDSTHPGGISRAIALDSTRKSPQEDDHDVDRREFIAAGMAGLLAVPPQAAHLAAGRRIGADLPALLRQRLARLRRLDDFLGGTDTYRLYLTELQATRTLAAEAACTGNTRRELLRLISEQAQQTGWAAFDAGWQVKATALYEESLAAARAAGDRLLEGNALALLAYQNLTLGKPAADLAAASCDAAGPGSPPAVRALLHERRAWAIAHAARQQPAAVERALDAAAAALGEKGDVPAPDWAAWVDHNELQIMTGRCFTRIGRGEAAIPVLRTVLSGFDDRLARDKSLYLSWLAEACLDSGDIEQAATVAGHALSLAEGVASVRPLQRLSGLVNRIGTHSSSPYVTGLLDQASQVMPAKRRG
jgi:transcriptional regulator with XRE-family HTH domain